MIEEGNMDVGDNRIWLAVLCLSQTAEDDVMIRPIGSQGNRLWLTSHDFHQAVSCLYSAHSELRRGSKISPTEYKRVWTVIVFNFKTMGHLCS